MEEWPGLPDSCRLEVASPFCFLCEKPQRLVVPQPLKGQHKLWQLPRSVLKVALQGLRDPPGLPQPPFSWRDFGDPRAMLAPAAATAAPSRGAGGAAGASCAGGEGARSVAQGMKAKGKAAPPPPPQQQPRRLGHGAAASQTEDGSAGGGGGGGGGGMDRADIERRLRALRKKLRQVAELERSGGALTIEQAAKLARAEEWRRELAELEAAAGAAATVAGAAVG